jgi:signal transduction histidine kinase
MTAFSDIQREWLAALAHELRSPIAAVAGYAELIVDGVLGDADPRVRDAVVRMNRAAEQMLAVIEGVEDLVLINDATPQAPETVRLIDLLGDAANLLRPDAESRGARIQVEESAATLRTRRDDAQRGISLALGAAVKSATGRTIILSADAAQDDAVTVRIAGSGVSVRTDDPEVLDSRQSLSGVAFRIALARAVLRRCDGSLHVHGTDGGADLVLVLPTLD